MKFAQRLKNIREEQNLTMEEMGSKLGISRQGYSRYEDIKAPTPTLEKIYQIAEKLNVDVRYLLGFTDNSGKIVENTEEIIYQDSNFKLLSDTRILKDNSKDRLGMDLLLATKPLDDNKLNVIKENINILIDNWSAYKDETPEEVYNYVSNLPDPHINMLYEYIKKKA